jgi:hypothetical protein
MNSAPPALAGLAHTTPYRDDRQVGTDGVCYQLPEWDRELTMDNYGEQCLSAAKAQGLDLLANALLWEGYGTELEQTGGFCMVLAIYTADDIVTVISGEGVDDYTLCRYHLDDWTGENSGAPITTNYGLNRMGVLDLLNNPETDPRGRIAEQPTERSLPRTGPRAE